MLKGFSSRIRYKLSQITVLQILWYYIRIIFGKEYTFVDINDYQKTHPNRVSFISRDMLSLSCQRVGEKEIKKGITIPLDIIKLSNVICYAYSNVIKLDNNNIYSDLKCISETKDIIDCSDKYYLIKDEKLWHKTESYKKDIYLENGILMTDVYSWNYFHFTMQILPRFRMIENIPNNIPLLLDYSCLNIPSYKALIEIFNKGRRQIIYMKERTNYHVRELYKITNPILQIPNIREGVFVNNYLTQYDIESLSFIRKTVLDHTKITPTRKRKLFLSRKKASGRRPFNEDECYDVLKELGFEKIFIEDYKFEEQVELFQNADFIVAGSGAAFTNLIYISESCKVICLVGFDRKHSIWQTLVSFANGKYAVISDSSRTKPPTKSTMHEAFNIAPQQLKSKILQWE